MPSGFAEESLGHSIGTLALLRFYAGATIVRDWKTIPHDVKGIEATARRLTSLIAKVPLLYTLHASKNVRQVTNR